MDKNREDIETVTEAVEDRGESVFLLEPLRIAADSAFRESLNDLALELVHKAAGFRKSLPEKLVPALAGLVRGMNCYYSNLIEGHDTHPVDIERALLNDYSDNPGKRNLQLEAKAHIEIQEWIDNGGLADRTLKVDTLLEIHRKFCRLLPDDLLWVKGGQNGKLLRVVPGELRKHDVKVGNHVAVSPGAVLRFMEKFEQAYSKLGRMEMLLATAAAHHRLLWIHPFLDGNGRVARLLSHAMMLEVLESGGVWSIARGLARNEQRYKTLLANCDQARRNALDGRGNLSEETLVQFIRFFLEICLDQVSFMESLMHPERLKERILGWAAERIAHGTLPSRSSRLLEAVIYRGGELSRNEVSEALDLSPRQARRIVAALIEEKVLATTGPKAPLNLNFSASFAGAWLPGLFPEQI